MFGFSSPFSVNSLVRRKWANRPSSRRSFTITSILERSDNKIWGSHFGVPRSIAEKLIDGRSCRVVFTLNGSDEQQRALLPRGDGSFVITVNKGLLKALNLEVGMKVTVTLRKDESQYGLPMPEELQELLRQDKDGDRLFHALTAGKRRTLLYIVASARDPEKRLQRSLVVIRHLTGC